MINKKVCEFINSCGAFFVLTIDENFPSGRPFGVIMNYENRLYITTGKNKNVYGQMKKNENICILALKHGARNWLRAKCTAKECENLDIKKLMIDKFPILLKRFENFEDTNFAVFEINILNACFY